MGNQTGASLVSEIGWEHVLRIPRGSNTKLSKTVITWVPGGKLIIVIIRRHDILPFNGEADKILRISVDKTGAPDLVWGPACGNARCNKEISILCIRITGQGLNKQAKFIIVVLWGIALRAMSMVSVEIRFISDLDADQVISENLLSPFCDIQLEIGYFKERDT